MRGALNWLAAAGCAVAAIGPAAQPLPDLDQRYPKGSITSAAVAETALADAAATRRANDAQFKGETARCTHVFLKNECKDVARRSHTQVETLLLRIELEAHDLQRKLAAQQREEKRRQDQAQQQKEEAERPDKERQAKVAAQKRSDKAKDQAQQAQRQQEQGPANRERYEQRNAQHDRDETRHVAELQKNSAENEHRYQEKQDRAKAYAISRAHEREVNQKAREEKERKRKAQMAEQTGRQDAAAAVSPAGGQPAQK